MSSMEFTLVVSNCLGCHFCPQEKLGRSYHSEKRIMAVDDFKVILAALPKDCQVHFSGYSEPFLNPDAEHMMGLAGDDGREVHLYTTLVGLRPEKVEILKMFPPRVTRIHVPDGRFLKFPEEKWVEFHETFLTTKIPASYMAMGEPSDFIKRHLAVKGIALELPDMLSRGGNLEDILRDPIDGPIHCTMNRWYNNVVLPNGDVYGCCMDYELTVYLGNLLRQPYREIKFQADIWKMNMEKRAQGICSKCEWARRP